MADRINTDECISRVYQFLNKQKDWQKAADINGDGTIIRTEFSAFILNSPNFEFNDGESKADLIAAFWKSIDVNVKGKVDIGRISNKNALDSKELATVEKNMEAESKVDSFIRTNYVCPSGLETYNKSIREAVKAGILNRAIELLNNGGDISELTDSKLQELYQSSMNKATADYKAIAMIDEKVKQKYGNENEKIDYKSADDEVRADIIDDYISQLNGTETQEQVSKDVEAIVNAYMDTAETNSAASTNLLAQYGYDPMDDLNPLQAAVLTKDLTEKVLKYLQSSNSDIVTGAFKAQAEAMVKAFVEEYLKDKRADEFSSLKNMSVSSSDFSSLITDINEQYTALKQAQQSLKDYVDSVLDENNAAKTRAVGDAVGSSEKTRAHDIIDKMTSVDDVDRVKAQLEALIDAIDKQLPDNFLNALTDITISASETKTITLPNNYGSYTTGHIHYSATGDGALKVNDSGAVTIGSSTPGVYTATVTVKDDNGNVLKSKTIKITVEMSAQSAVNNVTGWNNQVSNGLQSVLPNEDDSCTISDKLTDTSFADLYNKDYIVRLHLSMDDSESWESAQKIVNSRLDQLGNLIYSSLLTANLDTDILKSAVDSVISGYKFTSTAQMDRNLNDDDEGTDGYDITNNLAWRMKEDRNGTGHKVVGTRDDDGSDSWVWGVRFKDIVDDIIAKYKALGGN